ncbi:MAG: Ig domain-containing protein [Clostridia bacterium]|nr:Ig domain-containing protein [Clostridia bacterium]
MRCVKWLTAWLLIGALLLAQLTLSVAAVDTAASRPVSFSRYTLSVDLSTKTITMTVRAENHTEKPISCLFYSSLTDLAQQPDSVHSHGVTLQPGEQYLTLTHTYRHGQPGEKWVMNLFCWEKNMQPLSDSKQFFVTLEQTISTLTLAQPQVSLILTQNKTHTITHTVGPSGMPDPGAYYKSLTPHIVSVDEKGVVTPKAAGQGEILVVTKDYAAAARCTVTVISDVTRIALNQSAVTLGGDHATTFQLTATVTPHDAPVKQVTFVSSDTKVATVDNNGLIRFVAPGTATVTATLIDGSVSAKCTVTGLAIPTAVKLNQTAVHMWDYGEYQLKATVTGVSNAKVTYSSSNESVATVSAAGIIYGVDKGSAVITAAVGEVKATCTVTVHRECDYMGNIAAHFETKDNPASITGSGNSKYYGVLQISGYYDAPKNFYNWLISSGTHPEIGGILKTAHEKDGGKNKTYGTNFDATWKQLGTNRREEFRSCQMAYCVMGYYEPVANRLLNELNFDTSNYSIALKAAVLSRSIQHGTGGGFNRIRDALAKLGGAAGKTEREIITAIYQECGAVVDTPPSSTSVPMNSNSSIAVQYGLVGKYMKYYSSQSSSVQAGVWKRLNVTELNMLYDMLDHPPVVITPQK